jgi:anti-sigma-K factor RskA
MGAEEHVTEWLPAYALNLLTEEETVQVAEHLASCPTCREELHLYQTTADELPLGLVQSAPPPALKDRLMGEIRTRQMKAAAPSQATFWQRLAASFRQSAPAWSLAFIALLAFGNLLLWRQLNLANRQADTPMRVIALASTTDSPLAIGTLVMDPHGKYGTLVVDNLAPLDPGQQYQVWLNRSGERVSGGVFSVNPEGYASLEIMTSQPLIQYDSIGITIEPQGGSPGPTGAKVLGGVITP